MHWQTKHPVEFSKNTHHTKHNTHKRGNRARGFQSLAGQFRGPYPGSRSIRTAQSPRIARRYVIDTKSRNFRGSVRSGRFRDPDLSGSPQACENLRGAYGSVKSAGRDAGHNMAGAERTWANPDQVG